MKKFRFTALAAVLAAIPAIFCGSALAAESAAKQSDPKAADPRAAIAKKFPEVKVEDVQPSPIPGVYQVPLGADTAYVSADGRYIIAGDLYEIDTRTNLTEQGRAAARAKLLGKLDERDMIVFSPPVVKHTITVFTDVECGYCRKLHSQIDQLTKLGVKVRYAAYPRAGPGTDDWHKMEQVWCSKDRQTAITQAKLGQQVTTQNCGATPIGKQFQLGEDLGVRGTPAIFTRNGDYIGGYLAPAELVKQVEASEAREKKGS
jgi:thiol:disulfide interchange protein DsbC